MIIAQKHIVPISFVAYRLSKRCKEIIMHEIGYIWFDAYVKMIISVYAPLVPLS